MTGGLAFGPSTLAALGIDESEERAYRFLLSRAAATAEEVAASLAVPVGAARTLLDRVEAKALVSRSLERSELFVAAPPELAVEALIRGQHASLERARASIPDLLALASSAPRQEAQERLVEVINGRAALGLILNQLLQTVQTEIFAFQRAPIFYTEPNLNPPGDIRMRSISDLSYLGIPGRLETIRHVMELGEEARFLDPLPLKMVVVDRRVAVIPLSIEDPGGPSLLIRESSMVAALCALFDMTWERSTPIMFSEHGGLAGGGERGRLPETAEQILALLASGMQDKVIANTLGLSMTTLNRRLAGLMRRFDARSRFQLGWRAAQASQQPPE